MRGFSIAIAAMATALAVEPAAAQPIGAAPDGATIGGMGSGFALQAHVPVLCVTEFTPTLASGGGGMVELVELGDLETRCNAVHGYQVYVDYPPGLTGVALLVDGRAAPLDGTGRTLVLDAKGPEVRRIHVQARVQGGGSAPALDAIRFEDGSPRN